MNRNTLAALCLTSVTVGCADLGADLGAIDELLMSSISGAEDALSGESGSRMADDGSRVDASRGGDRSAAPPMFRTCDAEGTFIGMVDAYDADASGQLDGDEPAEVMQEHAGQAGDSGERGEGRKGPRQHFMHLLRVVYDTDRSGAFEDAEMGIIFEDFTARCESIHAEVLAAYDVDGDGALSESEQQAAREGHIAQMEADRQAVRACRDAQGGPPAEQGRPEAGEAPFGPLEQEFDGDGDGALSEAELETLRTELRARIASGEKPHPECDAE
ncbi:MAG: hypothetical protein CL927_11035 [Deltaproteobacteria bacterium]|nr:hypothetical protein [Deltaproteobacteria bacterium]